MFELVLMVCLLSNENECREYKVRGTESESLAACMNIGKVKAEEWLKNNDAYKIIGVRCGKGSSAEFAPGDKS
jgi:hypothetical protein